MAKKINPSSVVRVCESCGAIVEYNPYFNGWLTIDSDDLPLSAAAYCQNDGAAYRQLHSVSVSADLGVAA